jgi:hypothetical protein
MDNIELFGAFFAGIDLCYLVRMRAAREYAKRLRGVREARP